MVKQKDYISFSFTLTNNAEIYLQDAYNAYIQGLSLTQLEKDFLKISETNRPVSFGLITIFHDRDLLLKSNARVDTLKDFSILKVISNGTLKESKFAGGESILFRNESGALVNLTTTASIRNQPDSPKTIVS